MAVVKTYPIILYCPSQPCTLSTRESSAIVSGRQIWQRNPTIRVSKLTLCSEDLLT